MIDFKKYEEEAVILNPLKNFEIDAQKVEVRIDPLTGFVSFVRSGRKFWSFIYNTDYDLIDRIVSETRERCVFCSEKVHNSTPKFLENIVPEGRLKRNKAILFPNLFPHKAHSAIIVLSEKHYLRLDEFSPDILFDAFMLADDYLRRIYEKYGVEYAEIGANYLYPSGSSIVHPHIQVMLSKFPYTLIKIYDEKSKMYFDEKGINYFETLAEIEKKINERFVGELGHVRYLCPFAPIKEDEINGIVTGKSNFLEFNEDDWRSISVGISRILKAYHQRGLSAFNFAIYSGPLGKRLPYFSCGFKIVSRSGVQRYPVSDTWFANGLLFEGLVVEAPEDVAQFVKPFFSDINTIYP
ncbi:MAG: hypothetical protein N2513_07250 [Deltaproteobacteria bacterium]|nr:hypothetical protein [Deltaproteobacteria bacterium]